MKGRNPFLSKPKYQVKVIGNDDIGKIELPSYKGLIAGEQEALEEINESIPEVFSEVSKLAVKIRFAHDLPDNETLFCFDIVANSNWEEEQRQAITDQLASGKISQLDADTKLLELEDKLELFTRLRIEHSPEISELNQRLRKGVRIKRKRVVTALIKYRAAILPKDELKKLKAGFSANKERVAELEEMIETLDNWTEDDTNQLHSELLEELWKFAQVEMNGGKEESEEKVTAEAVGKLPEIPIETLPEAVEPIGEISSGDFSDIGQMTPDLALKTS